jgi:putative ABC transport system permease protein
MTSIWFDLRVALRTLLRAPWFSALAISTLALGIGLNTALFSLVDAVLLRPLPYHEPERLVEIWGQDEERTGMRVPGPFLEALRARSRTLSTIGIHGPVGGVLRTNDGLVDVRGDHVSANFLDLLGVRPLYGRGFLPGEDQPGAPPKLLASYHFWRQYLQSDPRAVGRTIYLDSLPHTVVGVMGADFNTQFRGYGAIGNDYWTTYVNERVRAFELEEGYELTARLAPSTTIDDVRRELDVIGSGVEWEGWGSGARRLGVVPLHEEVVRDSARALKLMLAAVALVLAIVCANLALLLLARSDRRIGEFATRKAIGAPATHLARLALLESLLLAAGGGALGIALAYAVLPLVLALAPTDIPRIATATVDARVLIVAVVLTLVAGCAFGLAPALRLARQSVLQVMKGSSAKLSPRSAAMRSALVLGQVAASVALCILAGLVGRTFLKLLPTDAGFDPRSIHVFVLSLSSRVYPEAAARQHVVEQMMRGLAAIPGVSAVGTASNVPFSTDDYLTAVREVANGAALPESRALVRRISPNYFDLLRIPLLRGRGFTEADGPDAPKVALVNQTYARRLGADGNVVGRTIRIGPRPDAPTLQIVGIVADARSSGSSAEIANEVFVPYPQRNIDILFLMMRSQLSSHELTTAVRSVIRSVAPNLPLREEQAARSLESFVHISLAAPRFSATLSTLFSVTALLLAAIGVFGLVAYSVAQRKREFGIRSALGAQPRTLAFTAMRSSIALTSAGVVLGLLVAGYLTRFVEKQLYAVEPLDLPTFAAAAALMLLVAGAAAAIPARAALRIGPTAVLRSD